MKPSFLVERRKKLGISQSDIAVALGYSSQMISVWESGRGVPNIQVWAKYANILELDLEGFLFDKIQQNNDHCKTMSFVGACFANNLKKLRISRGLTQKDVYLHLGFSNKTLSNLENGKSYPDYDEFIALADFYSCGYDAFYFAYQESIHASKQPSKSKKLWIIASFALAGLLALGSIIPIAISLNASSNNAETPVSSVTPIPNPFYSDDYYHWKKDGDGNIIDKAEHVFDSFISKQPTCLEAGESTFRCAICNHEIKTSIEALGHISDGSIHYNEEYHYDICTRDQVAFHIELHQFDATVIDNNQIRYTCNVCHYQKVEDIADYLINKDTLYFGSYPQSHVSDPELIETLNGLSSPDERGYYAYGGDYYVKRAAALDDGSFAVHAHDYFDDDVVINAGQTYWFRVDPIQWNIIEENEDSYLLISSYILDGGLYDEDSNNYEDSDIRNWLNTSFLDMAISSSNEKVLLSEVDNTLASTPDEHNSYVGDNTLDKVFLPSVKDLTNVAYGFFANADRVCSLTDFARTSGMEIQEGFTGAYFTRTPHPNGQRCFYFYDHRGHQGSATNVAAFTFGIRPLIRISK